MPVPMTTLVGATVVAVGILAAGCAARSDAARPAVATPPPARSQAAALALGATQPVSIASAFGPGRADVPATIRVLRVQDHVAPGKLIEPIAAASHWASAEVEVCPQKPVVLGYPAWVLGDDSGRTAQVTRVLHPQFPQPPLRNGITLTRCTSGWVTWVTPNDLKPTQVSFEQAYDVPNAWRVSP
jgi:hypothetical protein